MKSTQQQTAKSNQQLNLTQPTHLVHYEAPEWWRGQWRARARHIAHSWLSSIDLMQTIGVHRGSSIVRCFRWFSGHFSSERWTAEEVRLSNLKVEMGLYRAWNYVVRPDDSMFLQWIESDFRLIYQIEHCTDCIWWGKSEIFIDSDSYSLKIILQKIL